MKTIVSKAIGVVTVAACLCGCVQINKYGGLEPVSPKPGKVTTPVCESVTPTFQWKDKDAATKKYDVGIWKYHNGLRGERVYYREGIQECSHTVEEPLALETPYYWSVRVSGSPTWSTYSWMGAGMGMTAYGQGEYFLFRTPKAK